MNSHMQVEKSEGASMLPTFPVALGPDEMISLYRNAMRPDMRSWVTFAISDLVVFPEDASDARVIGEHLATQAIGRGLYACEAKLLDEVLRDILTARIVMRDLEVLGIRNRLAVAS